MSINLEDLTDAFKSWQNGMKKQGRIPIHLKQHVIELCQRHSLKELSDHLGLKESTVKKWQERTHIAEKRASIARSNFIKLTNPPKQIEASSSFGMQTLTIELPNGIKLIFNGQKANEMVEFTGNLAKRFML